MIDAATAYALRREAEALAASQGLALKEAKRLIWNAYQTQAQAAGPEPPTEPERAPASEAPSTHASELAPRWNDTGARGRKPWASPTAAQKANAARRVQDILGVIAQGKSKDHRSMR